MAIQEQYVLSKDANGDARLVQNSVNVITSINASAIVNTLYLKEGMVGLSVVPTSKLHIQVASEGNKQALLIEQLDTTNNPICAEINNDGTNHGIYYHQDGVLATDKYGLYIYSNAVQVNSTLVYLRQDNASSTSSLCLIQNDGTGNCLYVQQDGVLASDKHGFFLYSNSVQVNSYLAKIWQHNSSSTTVPGLLHLLNEGKGHCLLAEGGKIETSIIIKNTSITGGQASLYLQSYSVGFILFTDETPTSKGAIGVDVENNWMSFRVGGGGVGNIVLTLRTPTSTYDVAEINNDGTGHALYIHQDGNLASGKYALYIDNNGTPVDGSGRCIRLDGCTISGTGAILGYIGINVDGTQRAVPYYAIA